MAAPFTVHDCVIRRLGEPEALPRAAALAVKGMREGGRRRVLLPPQGGWVTERTQVALFCFSFVTACLALSSRRQLIPHDIHHMSVLPVLTMTFQPLLQPIPASFGGRRRLATHRGDPLLFEAKLVRVRPPETANSQVRCVLAMLAGGGVQGSPASMKAAQLLVSSNGTPTAP